MGESEAVLPLEEPTIKGEHRQDLIDQLVTTLTSDI